MARVWRHLCAAQKSLQQQVLALRKLTFHLNGVNVKVNQRKFDGPTSLHMSLAVHQRGHLTLLGCQLLWPCAAGGLRSASLRPLTREKKCPASKSRVVASTLPMQPQSCFNTQKLSFLIAWLQNPASRRKPLKTPPALVSTRFLCSSLLSLIAMLKKDKGHVGSTFFCNEGQKECPRPLNLRGSSEEESVLSCLCSGTSLAWTPRRCDQTNFMLLQWSLHKIHEKSTNAQETLKTAKRCLPKTGAGQRSHEPRSRRPRLHGGHRHSTDEHG